MDAKYHRIISKPFLALIMPILSKVPILRNRFGKKLAKLGELTDYQVITDAVLYNGMSIVVARGTKGGDAIFRSGVYEPDAISMLEKIIKPGMVFLDIGANIGQYSLVASPLVGADGKIYSFEPNPRINKYLIENINRNKLRNIQVCRCVISDFDGEAEFYISKARSIGTSSLFRHKYTSERIAKVPSKTLDAFAREMELEKIDVIKLDIEGSEFSAISGAPDVFGGREPPIVFIEFNEYMLSRAGRSCSELYSLLLDLGYKIFRLDKHGASKYTLEDILRLSETSRAINMLAWPPRRENPPSTIMVT